MLKEIFHDSYKISKFTRICMETHSSVTGWQKLFFSYKSFCFSAAVAMATFAIRGWKFTGYLILICFYSSCYFSKPICFCVYRKSLFNVPTNSHGVWAACASTIKKRRNESIGRCQSTPPIVWMHFHNFHKFYLPWEFVSARIYMNSNF